MTCLVHIQEYYLSHTHASLAHQQAKCFSHNKRCDCHSGSTEQQVWQLYWGIFLVYTTSGNRNGQLDWRAFCSVDAPILAVVVLFL